MAYTNPWNEAAPVDGAAANSIDDLMRTDKLNIRERMNSIVVDWTADPVVLKPASTLKTGMIQVYAGFILQPEEDEDDVNYFDKLVVSDNNDANTFRGSIHVLKNWKITKFEALVDKGGEANVTVSFNRTTFNSSATNTVVGTSTNSSAGIQTMNVFTGTETVDGNSYYWVKVSANSAAAYNVYAFRLTYDEV